MATVAPHQDGHAERPDGYQNNGHQPGDRIEEANVGHHHAAASGDA
ncbi:MAG TPA: hypothetical protein PKE45_07060 [Caldilineaceae bacterium]|nr:hypothetical protein [Caldilineaceae bacterium]